MIEYDSVVFDGTLQAFYQASKYYELRSISKVVERSSDELKRLSMNHKYYGIYPEDAALLDVFLKVGQ